jgi:hypothetical protein
LAGPDWKLEDDRKLVTAAFPTNPPVELKLDAAGVDELLNSVGKLRAHMLPEHNYDDPRGKRRDGVTPNPRWATETDLMFGHVLLHLRDSRYGTVSFLMPPEAAQKLGQSLIDLASAPLPQPGSGKAN